MEINEMKTCRLALNLRIPPYAAPRNIWRKQIHTIVKREAERRHVTYKENDRLQIDVRLYMNEYEVLVHDVDNRLKDILDALQGAVGGPKSFRKSNAIIPNDNQIFRVTLEKILPPKQSHGFGHVRIRKYVPSIKVRR